MTSTTGHEDPVVAAVAAVLAFPLIPGAVALVAYSGGQDSSCLLDATVRACGEAGRRTVAAYLDHGLRAIEERTQELALVRRRARLLGVPLVVERLRPGWLESRAPMGLEAAARRERRRFLASSARTLGTGTVVLLGHTLDDQLETLLMRFLQGATFRGMGGVPSRSRHAGVAFLRPFLPLRRGQIRAYLRRLDIEFSQDSTNTDRRFLRNRLRPLLPALEAAVPGSAVGMVRAATSIAAVRGALRAEVGTGEGWVQRRAWLEITLAWLHGLPRPLQEELVFDAFDQLMAGASGIRLPLRFVARVLQLSREGTGVASGHGVVFAVQRGRLQARRVVRWNRIGYAIHVKLGGTYRIKGIGLTVRRVVGRSTSAGSHQLRLPAVQDPLLFRSWRPGDSFEDGSGIRSVSELLRNWGVPEEMRAGIPVVADRGGVVAVAGSVFGFEDCVRPVTRAREDSIASVLVLDWCKRRRCEQPR